MSGQGGAGRPGRLRGWWWAGGAVVAVAVAVTLLTMLVADDRAGGTDAIELTKTAVAVGLRDTETRIVELGGTLRVSWSAVPSPSGDAYLVAARLVVEPSGDVGSAQFSVSGGGVVPRNDLAERLLEGRGGS